MNRKSITALLVATCLVTLAAARLMWNGTQQAGPHSAKSRTYALNVVNSTIPAWIPANDVLSRITEVTPGLTSEFGGPTDGDASKQIEQVNALVGKHVSGILLCAADPHTLLPTINQAAAAGVPVVTIFGDVPGSNRLTSITAAEELSAHNLGAKVAVTNHWSQAPNGSVEVMIMTTKPGLVFSDQRLAGIQELLKEYKAVKVIRIVSNDWSDTTGAEAVAATLQQHPDLKAIFGLDSRSAIGAVSALKEASKKKGEVLLTGWDSDQDTLDAIASGWVFATSAPNMTYMTQLGISILDAATLGYLYPQSLKLKDYNLPALPDHIDIQQTIIDAANVQAFTKGSFDNH